MFDVQSQVRLAFNLKWIKYATWQACIAQASGQTERLEVRRLNKAINLNQIEVR